MDEFQQADPKFGVKNPCWFCGEEATVECNLCPKIGLETFFCSPQHQTIVWKHHVRTCHPPVTVSFENNSYNAGVIQMPPPPPSQQPPPAPQNTPPSYNPSYDAYSNNNNSSSSSNNNNNNNNNNSALQQRREPPQQPPLPRYSSPNARQSYS